MMQKRCGLGLSTVWTNVYNKQGVGKSNTRKAASPQLSQPRPFLGDFAGYGKALLLIFHKYGI